MESVKEDQLELSSGDNLQADCLVLCTGWGDHFGMFDAETKAELGLPVDSPSVLDDSIKWKQYDSEAEKLVDQCLPLLATSLVLKHAVPATSSRYWCLYRCAIPISLAQKGDRSIAILGQIHTVQTPLLSEVQSFWSILYVLGELELPSLDEMAREVSLWNAWTRKRYLTQGHKFPYSLYEFLPVCLSYHMNINPSRVHTNGYH